MRGRYAPRQARLGSKVFFNARRERQIVFKWRNGSRFPVPLPIALHHAQTEDAGSLLAEDADVGEVAEVLVGVHAVAHKVLRRGAEPEPVCLRLLPFGRDVLVDQDAGAAGRRAVRQKLFLKFGEREPGIEDIVDQEAVAAPRVEFHPAAQRELPGGRVVEVGAGRERIHAHRQIDVPQQIGGEEEPAVHHDDGGDLKSGIGSGDFVGDLGDAAFDRLRVDQGGEGNGHRRDQAPFPAAFFRVPVVE